MIIPAGSSQTCFQSIFSYLRRFPKVRAGLLIFRLKYLVFSRNFVKTPYSRAQHVGLNWSGWKNVINSVILLTKGLVWQIVSAHSIFRKNLFDSILSTGKALWRECNNVQNLLPESERFFQFVDWLQNMFNFWKRHTVVVQQLRLRTVVQFKSIQFVDRLFFTRLQHFVQNKRILSRVALAYCQILTTLYGYDSNRTQSKCFLKAP